MTTNLTPKEHNRWTLEPDGITWKNECHGLAAYVKWDGCSHLWFPEQVEEHPDGCYHHICDIDDFLEAMQTLRTQVAEHFDQKIAAMRGEERRQMALPFHLDTK